MNPITAFRGYGNWTILIAAELVYVAVSTWISVAFHHEPMTAEILRTVARLISLTIYVPIFLLRFRKTDTRDPIPVGRYGLVVLAAVCLFLFPWFFQKSGVTGTLQLLWFWASFIVGFREEIFYRGMVQQTLTEKLGLMKALLITSAVFTCYHVSHFIYGNWIDWTEAFLFSLSLGLIYAATKSIVVVAMIHGIYDAIPFVTPFRWDSVPYYWGLSFLLLGLAVCLCYSGVRPASTHRSDVSL